MKHASNALRSDTVRKETRKVSPIDLRNFVARNQRRRKLHEPPPRSIISSESRGLVKALRKTVPLQNVDSSFRQGLYDLGGLQAWLST